MDALLRRRQMMASGATPLPYTPVDYIATDGVAYIDTGINGNDPRSVELKYMISSLAGQCPIGVGKGTEDTSLYYLLYITGSAICGFGHRYFYTGSGIQASVNVPFEAKCAMKQSSQVLQVKNQGESSFTSFSKSQSTSITTNKSIFLFSAHNPTTDAPQEVVPSGSRMYYCRIYTTNTYTNLVFDGVPCLYNGEYGMWDRVSDSFFGNANSTGAFSGPSNS